MLGPQHCIALPLFHALTGCDVVSAMFGIGKKTAWNAWFTDTLIAITEDHTRLTLKSPHMLDNFEVQ